MFLYAQLSKLNMVTTIEQTNQNASTDFCGNYAKGISLTSDQQSVTISSASFWLETGSSKTGTISCNVLSDAGVSLGTLGTLDASTIPTDSVSREYIFNTTSVSTNATDCFISLVVPSSACGLGFRYATAPSTYDYQGFYQTTSSSVPVTTSQPYPKFSATYSGSGPSPSGDTVLLPPPVAWI